MVISIKSENQNTPSQFEPQARKKNGKQVWDLRSLSVGYTYLTHKRKVKNDYNKQHDKGKNYTCIHLT